MDSTPRNPTPSRTVVPDPRQPAPAQPAAHPEPKVEAQVVTPTVVEEPTGPVPVTYTTPHQLHQMLGESMAVLARNPTGREALMKEVQRLQTKLATPGFNPSPQDMYGMQEQVNDVVERVRVGELERVAPHMVTIEDVQQRFQTAEATVARLKTGKEGFTQELDGVKKRIDATMTPYSQVDLDAMNTMLMAVLTRIEDTAGQQGV